jgi:hypothetical protein
MSREAMHMALHTLEGWANYGKWVWPESALEQAKRNTTESIAALRQALETEREWVGLTADEIWKCNKASGSAVEFHICYAHQNVLDFAESIELALKEKNKW